MSKLCKSSAEAESCTRSRSLDRCAILHSRCASTTRHWPSTTFRCAQYQDPPRSHTQTRYGAPDLRQNTFRIDTLWKPHGSRANRDGKQSGSQMQSQRHGYDLRAILPRRVRRLFPSADGCYRTRSWPGSVLLPVVESCLCIFKYVNHPLMRELVCVALCIASYC